MRPAYPLIAVALLVQSCATPPPPAPEPAPPILPARDAYLKPDRVDDGKLQYTDDYATFAPFMARRTGYPTQQQAQYAFQRSQWHGMPFKTVRTRYGAKVLENVSYQPDFPTTAIRLFACSPGALDGITGRIVKSSHPLVHCATDLLGPNHERLARVPLNFYYTDKQWRLQDPNPSYRAPEWRNREPSPRTSQGRLWFQDRTRSQ